MGDLPALRETPPISCLTQGSNLNLLMVPPAARMLIAIESWRVPVLQLMDLRGKKQSYSQRSPEASLPEQSLYYSNPFFCSTYVRALTHHSSQSQRLTSNVQAQPHPKSLDIRHEPHYSTCQYAWTIEWCRPSDTKHEQSLDQPGIEPCIEARQP